MKKTAASTFLFMLILLFSNFKAVPAFAGTAGETVLPSDTRITYLGRYNTNQNGINVMNWEGSGVGFNVQGSGFTVTLQSNAAPNGSYQAVKYRIFVYEGSTEVKETLISVPVALSTQEVSQDVTLPDSTKTYHIEVLRITEADDTSSKKATALVNLKQIALNSDSIIAGKSSIRKTIAFYGDSITAGFFDGTNGGTYGDSDLGISYAFQTTQQLKKDLCPDLSVSTINAVYTALSGIAISNTPYWQKKLSDFYNQLQYSYDKLSNNILPAEHANIVVVNIGTNDMTGYFLNQDADGPNKYAAALKTFVSDIRVMNPDAVIILTLWGTYSSLDHSAYWDAVQKVVSDFNNDPTSPDPKILYFYPVGLEGNGHHPTKAFAGEFAAKLKAFIENQGLLPATIY
ncbi:GDSL-type esterase/lipase family protein [Lentisphaerota bacterium ZTH]|nr:hypothetical protein JYG24_08090 [Lentisphaerota bacterium]WET06546.1 GDSL-type esterase/lipase family protein [Lentisphaerota bacterium ZTH]